jgi:hypothetical protein
MNTINFNSQLREILAPSTPEATPQRLHLATRLADVRASSPCSASNAVSPQVNAGKLEHFLKCPISATFGFGMGQAAGAQSCSASSTSKGR